ncbi:MAG TPA: MFS transporter [Tepidisphaeraceae bacterium]|nr:MFS transporter [Tepidisphaeraceae bacterium]
MRPAATSSRAWLIGAVGFLVFVNVYSTQSLLPLLRLEFPGASTFHASLTVAATTIGIALAAPLAGLLAERLGRKATITGALALITLPVCGAATAPTLDALIVWRLAQGLLMPGVIAVAMAYIAEEWPGPGQAAHVMGVYVAGNVLGGVCGRVASALLADFAGWRVALLVLGVVNAVGAAVVWRWLPRSAAPHAPTPWGQALRDMRAHLKRPEMLATFGLGLAALFALAGSFTWITFYLAGPPFGLSTAAVGLLFLVYMLGVIVTPFTGPIIARTGHRAAWVGAAVVSIAGVALTLVATLPTVVAGLALISTGVFVCQSAAASYLGLIAGRGRASAAGLYTTFYYLGGTLGAAAPALVWSRGGWPACVALIAAVLAAGCACALLGWRRAKVTTTATRRTSVEESEARSGVATGD